MTAITTPAFRIHALPAEALDRARRTGDPARVVAGGGEPVRCCLRDAEPGEELMGDARLVVPVVLGAFVRAEVTAVPLRALSALWQ
jgi:hypothetical protein